MRLSAFKRQVDAEVEARVARLHLRDLGEPGARHHHGAAGADAPLDKLHKGHIGAVAHAEIVGVDDDLFGRTGS